MTAEIRTLTRPPEPAAVRAKRARAEARAAEWETYEEMVADLTKARASCEVVMEQEGLPTGVRQEAEHLARIMVECGQRMGAIAARVRR